MPIDLDAIEVSLGSDIPRMRLPGLVPGIHANVTSEAKTWMAGTSPRIKSEGGHDGERRTKVPYRKSLWRSLPMLEQTLPVMPAMRGCKKTGEQSR
jgi:hypothetical protein